MHVETAYECFTVLSLCYEICIATPIYQLIWPFQPDHQFSNSFYVRKNIFGWQHFCLIVSVCSCSVAQSQKVCNTKISFSWVSRSWSCRPSLTWRDRCRPSSHVVSLKRQKFANHWPSDTDWVTLIRKKRKFSCKHTSLFLVLTRNSTSFIYLLCTKLVKC